ncbi:hypothetical protein [Pseudonocardia sp. N23]|uniref:hypothetical protein n=1 Tax=Pseudonocardia sp. N23 TaxID=1987376 RepID=UPI000C0262D6|nr:hypothetical protein [Pseudonocardia sp. N23]GAY12586.1 hypothetical protein TOK_1074 [Pseudonocardia sp. N23]
MALTQITTPEPNLAQLSAAEFDDYLGWLSREVYGRGEPVEVSFPADFEPPF